MQHKYRKTQEYKTRKTLVIDLIGVLFTQIDQATFNEYENIKDQEGFQNEFIILKNEGQFERMCCANYKT